MYLMFVGAQATSKLDCGLCMTEVIFLKHLPICKICRSSHGFSSTAKLLRITGTGGYCVRTYCAEIKFFPIFCVGLERLECEMLCAREDGEEARRFLPV